MKSIGRYLRYFWAHMVMKVTWALPDWEPILRLRGFLLSPSFGACGKNLQVASGVVFTGDLRGLEYGDDVYIATGVWLGVAPETSIRFAGENLIAPYCVIVSGNHAKIDGSYRFGEGHRESVKIGYGTWLAAGVKVLPGVSIGRGVLCAAGAVITRDVEDDSKVGGVPAKRIG